MAEQPRSIYARMRDLILAQGKDPFNEDYRKRAAEVEQTELELLEHRRKGYVTEEECLIALVRIVLTHAPIAFYPYKDAWRDSSGFSAHKAAANSLIIGDVSGTPVSDLRRIPLPQPLPPMGSVS